MDTYANRVGMRVDAVDDHLVERPLERHLRNLALLEEQVRVDRREHGGLRWRDELVERLRRRLRATFAVSRQRALRERRRRRLARDRRDRVERRPYWRRGGRRAGRCRAAPEGQVWRRAEHANDGWVTVVQLRHRVEQVRDEPRAAHDRGRRDVRGRNTVDASGESGMTTPRTNVHAHL